MSGNDQIEMTGNSQGPCSGKRRASGAATRHGVRDSGGEVAVDRVAAQYRGFDEAATVLGPDFAGVLVRDGWAAYRRFKRARHQTCLAHLLRRCKHLQTAHPDDPWAANVQAVLQDSLALRDRRQAGEASEHGLTTARGRLVARLGRLLDTPPPLADAECFAKHLTNEFPAVFLFSRPGEYVLRALAHDGGLQTCQDVT